ncbi:hypothetical protein [Halopiger xanaduensis]|uniref:Transmembrane protein n=1 Tax=Halopiger xanaduensis (strain DSM 18323 / JCM 14033 / SH-6) TaxID=797210 RepID=F8DBE3_HALXS|nr:hypothetical protein [Halopiger xanaduensis]AEH37058.1 hypothetical protein Halxa_2439 [Halopiger xanaduensis SH-6]
MKLAHVTLLEDFGTRSLATHGLMAIAFVNAILAGLVVGGELGRISFVALLNVTAGLWIAHSLHSLGNVATDDEYEGILNELLDTDDEFSQGLATGRFGRLLVLIAAVTAVSLLTSAQVLSGTVFQIAVVGVGSIAVVTAIIGFLIALGASHDASQQQWRDRIDENPTQDSSDAANDGGAVDGAS